MLDKFLEDYIDTLYQNSNLDMKNERLNLYSKRDYYELLKPVIETIKNHKDYSIQELRENLYKKSGLEESVKNFINQKEMCSGLVFTYGTPSFQETVVIGNRQEVSLDDNNHFVPSFFNMTTDTIVDLASVTKVYTSLSIFKLVSLGLINLDDEVVKYAPQFTNLKGVKIFDLLTFKTNLQTARIDQVTSYEEGEKLLFEAKVSPLPLNKNPYSDIGAMVLKYVIEGSSQMNYYDFLSKYILEPLQMTDTHVIVPNYKLDRTINTMGGVKYYKDGNVDIDNRGYLGLVHDPKARVLTVNGDLPGHAGLFSTTRDMSKLAKGMIDGKIIDSDLLREMATNRTGKPYLEDDKVKYLQYLGSLCYSKNPRLEDSEVFHALSGRTLGSGGFVGTQLTVDPINELYFFMAGNKPHNRLIYIDETRKNEVITLESGKKIVKLPNGQEVIDASRFAWDRDADVVIPSVKLAIQYKMLEDFYKLVKEDVKYQENIRTL